jgi:hypothetical protein
MRFLFFLLLVANAAFAAHIWLTETRAGEDPSKREINREALKIVSVANAESAVRTAARVIAAKQLAERLSSAACIELNGVRPADVPRAQQAFAGMNLAYKLDERKLEEISRYWVFMPAARDRKTADATMTSLRKQGIKDFSLLADNAISLGVFSSDEAASRYLAEVQGKGVKGADKGPRSSQAKEYAFTVREPDTSLVARLTLMQAEFEGSALKAVTCPADHAAEAQTTNAAPAKR